VIGRLNAAYLPDSKKELIAAGISPKLDIWLLRPLAVRRIGKVIIGSAEELCPGLINIRVNPEQPLSMSKENPPITNQYAGQLRLPRKRPPA